MASAKIGALHVSLGLDSANFQSGLNLAQGNLGRFRKVAVTAFGAVAAAGLGAATAMGIAIKAAADHADTLSKTAQKIGVTTEALSRLEWAARLSDLSLEQLSGGLKKLSQNMLDVASGSKGPAAEAFNALGISVSDASGQLRSADDVLADVADRFGRMEDGATKTALAVRLFGKSGAELIPLLNAGRAGLKAMADESDRLGQTISTETGKAAEEFNDNLTRLGAVTSGLANKMMAELVPSLANLTATMASPEFQTAIVNTTRLLGGLADVLARTVILAGELINVLPKAVGAGEDKALYAMPGYEDFIRQHEVGAGGSDGIGGGAGSFGGLLATMGVASPAAEKLTVDLNDLATASTAAKTAIDPFAARIDELSGVLTATVDPFEQMRLDLTDLKTMFDNGRIGVEQYGEAVRRTNLLAASSTLGMAGQVTDALAGLFKDNKAFAVASAVINTAEGVTKALAQGGLFGFIGAAAVAAAGAAQIASILSAEPGSSNTASVSAPAPDVPVAQGAGQATPSVNVTLKGGGRYSRNEIEQLFRDINDAMGDGLKLNVAVT